MANSNPDTAETKILAILDEMDSKLTGTPKHWEKTPERIAIENEAVAQLKGLLVDAPERTWWVTLHDVPDEPRKIAGPFTTSTDASLCREQLEKREGHNNYWLEQLQHTRQEEERE